MSLLLTVFVLSERLTLLVAMHLKAQHCSVTKIHLEVIAGEIYSMPLRPGGCIYIYVRVPTFITMGQQYVTLLCATVIISHFYKVSKGD